MALYQRGRTWYADYYADRTRVQESTGTSNRRSGADLVTVKELLGHATISTTMRYAHSNHDAKARAVALLRSSDKIVTIVPRKQKSTKMS
jgi:integrase